MEKFFTNDKVFSIVAIGGFVCSMLYSISCLVFWNGILASTYASAAILMLINGISVLCLYISYKKHSKNVMKGLIGVLLYGSFATVCTITFPYTNTFALDIICSFALLALTLAILVNHFIINSDHKSRKNNIRVNQCLAWLIVIVAIIWPISWIPYLKGIAIIFQFITSIGIIFIVGTIVCVESRLDAYRLDREAAGWSEEAGYPEGYVHQKDRKKK